MGWVANSTLRVLYPPERYPLPIEQEVGEGGWWSQGQNGRVRKTSTPSGVDRRTVQSVASC